MTETNIFVCGHNGMVGSSIVRNLSQFENVKLITADRNHLDLLDQSAVKSFMSNRKIDQVYLAAAKVGGIHSNNKYPFDFLYQNLIIQNNVIGAAFESKLKKLMFLGSSCIYPKDAVQPMSEDALLTGCLEETNEPYAIAKIAGIKLCESINRQYASTGLYDYRSIMPTNLYGPGDNYDPENSHVIPGLMRRMHKAKIERQPKVKIWGSGRPRREFLYVDDLAKAAVHLMNLNPETYWSAASERLSHINVGGGNDISILELAFLIKKVVGYEGELVCDESMPDGSPQKLMDSTKAISLGWRAQVGLYEGLTETYSEFVKIEN